MLVHESVCYSNQLQLQRFTQLCTHMPTEKQHVTCSNGTQIAFDVLSLDIGSRTLGTLSVPGVHQHAITTRPINGNSSKSPATIQHNTMRRLTIGTAVWFLPELLAKLEKAEAAMLTADRSSNSEPVKVQQLPFPCMCVY